MLVLSSKIARRFCRLLASVTSIAITSITIAVAITIAHLYRHHHHHHHRLRFGRIPLGSEEKVLRRFRNTGRLSVSFEVRHQNFGLMVIPKSGTLEPSQELVLEFSFRPIDEDIQQFPVKVNSITSTILIAIAISISIAIPSSTVD